MMFPYHFFTTREDKIKKGLYCDNCMGTDDLYFVVAALNDNTENNYYKLCEECALAYESFFNKTQDGIK